MRTLQTGVAALAMVLAGAAWAGSTDLNFVRVTDSGAVDISSQLCLTVSSVTGQANKVDLTFRNFALTVSSVSEIYFEDSSLLASATLIQQGTVFVGATGNLPGSSTLDPFFTATRSYRVSAGALSEGGSGVNTAGLDRASDFVTFRFNLNNGATPENVLQALAAQTESPFGSLRVAVVAKSIGGSGRSDSFINSALFVPLPPAAWAGIVGLAAVAGFAWARRRGHTGV